jgi:glycosyltransferase involved in cell wall biosynthesis
MQFVDKSKPLKLLFLTTNVRETGTYFRAYYLGKALCRMGHEVTLVTMSRKKLFGVTSSSEEGMKIVEAPNFLHDSFISSRIWLEPGHSPYDIVKRIRLALSSSFDIIQLFDHFHNVAIPFFFLRQRVNSKFISDWCDVYHLSGGLRETYGRRLDFIYRKIGFLFRSYNRWVELRLRKMADGVTVISDKLRQFAIEHEVPAEKLFVIQGGVDIDFVRPYSKEDAREKLGLPRDARILEFMGRFQGDLDIVLKSFAIVRQCVPNSLLLVVGEPYESTGRLAANLGINGSLIQAGRCSNDLLPFYLASADAFALPLRPNLNNEVRWANKFSEYLAAGRPIIISGVGDQAAIVQRHSVGFVASQDIQDFASKVRCLLENRSLALGFGLNARKLACEKFTWEAMASKLEGVFYRTLENQPH